ncbi:MAG: aminotransferase class III-fold pyridoxal phosphate-dependent enzyme, partial [Leptospiraceae bacterium]|nr:aminotransferase class III-fold pyridoxal phosphate-dependent enzyme [Leptospiraceae bacterium]
MIWHPYTIQKNSPLPIKILSAKDEFVYDEDGKEYIDAISSWWISIHGHNRKELIQAAKEQLDRLDQILLAGFTNEPAQRLAQKLIEITNHQFYKVFYSDNGSCANEIAIKMTLQYFKNLGLNNKNLFIKFSLSYHGDTIGAMSVSGNSIFNLPFKEVLFNTKEFTAPDCSYCPVGKLKNTCRQECLNEVKNFILVHKKQIAGIIIEPLVFGASGMRMYKSEVLQELYKIAKENEVLLILDEVFTGFGRTGVNFAYESA